MQFEFHGVYSHPLRLKLEEESSVFSYGAPPSVEAASMILISLCFSKENSDHVAVSPVAACTNKTHKQNPNFSQEDETLIPYPFSFCVHRTYCSLSIPRKAVS